MPSSPAQRRHGLRSRRTKRDSLSDHEYSRSDLSSDEYQDENSEDVKNREENDEPDCKMKSGPDRLPSKQKKNVKQPGNLSPKSKKIKPGPRILPPKSKTNQEQVPQTPIAPKVTPVNQQGTNHLFCLTCFIIIPVIAVGFLYPKFTDINSVPVHVRETAFLNKLNKLKGVFPSQSERFWSIIAAAPMTHLKSHDPPERPVVVMLVGQPGTDSTTACMATCLGELYTVALGGPEYSVVSVNGTHFSGHDGDEAKTKLDTQLMSGFESHSKAAIVHRFDKIPACSVLLFHSYCENDNAKYKDVAIVMTVELEEHVDVTSFKDIDTHVAHHLTKQWSICPDLQKDKKDAILSRVANNVALVTAEQDLSSVCQRA